MLNIVQGLTQIDELYGKPARESMLQNSALQVFFASNDETTTQYVSRRFGDKTAQTESISFGQSSIMGTKSQSYAKTDFLRPEEFRRFCKKQAVIFKEGARPIKVDKITYFKDRSFQRRVIPAAGVPNLETAQPQLPVFNIMALKHDEEVNHEDIQQRVIDALEY
tara:strand:- start:9725 stop:10219 length:495 start_codon:yes stop_codon:yes gene_type:complete